MISVLKNAWPPTKSCKLSVFWALVFGFVLQFALPVVMILLGSKGAALLSILDSCQFFGLREVGSPGSVRKDMP
jgi:hypothetical protein